MNEKGSSKNGAWRVLTWALGILIALNVGVISYTLQHIQSLEIQSVETQKDLEALTRYTIESIKDRIEILEEYVRGR